MENATVAWPSFYSRLLKQWERGKFVSIKIDSLNSDTARRIVDATHHLVCAYEIPVFFGNGNASISALRNIVQHVHGIDPYLLVILDGGGIAHYPTGNEVKEATSEHFGADAVTLNPYPGFAPVQHFLGRVNKGVVIPCRTSRSDGNEFQDIEIVRWFSDLIKISDDYDEVSRLSGIMGWCNPSGQCHVPFYQYLALCVSRRWNFNKNCILAVGVECGGTEELLAVAKIAPNITILVECRENMLLEEHVKNIVQAVRDSNGQGMIIESPSTDLEYIMKLHNLVNRYRLGC